MREHSLPQDPFDDAPRSFERLPGRQAPVFIPLAAYRYQWTIRLDAGECPEELDWNEEYHPLDATPHYEAVCCFSEYEGPLLLSELSSENAPCSCGDNAGWAMAEPWFGPCALLLGRGDNQPFQAWVREHREMLARKTGFFFFSHGADWHDHVLVGIDSTERSDFMAAFERLVALYPSF